MLQAVEGREDQTDPLAHRAALEELEARDVVLVERDDLAVQDKVVTRQATERTRHLRELYRHVLQVARHEPDAAAVAIGDDAVAVVLLLVDPAGAVEGLAHQRRQHGTDQPPHRRRALFGGSPVAAFSTSPPSSAAIRASVRRLRTERGAVSVMSSFDA